jgi:hypothetical protein
MHFRHRAALLTVLLLGTSLAAAADEPNLTFAVIGDNRGYTDGRQSAAFLKIVDELVKAKPALVLHTGDMVAGDIGSEENLRQQWKAYKECIAQLKMPIYHAPGNHDTDTLLSLKLYPEYWGKMYYAVEEGGCLFIALDTETHNGQLGDEQWAFLEKTLDGAGTKPTFVFFHRPLFTYGVHVKFCLDEFPDQRDRLHRLFVAHRRNIKAVFVGHEHLYAHDERDGIHYYTCGGGGAVLYAPPELGGFYHYLMVQVKGDEAKIELRKILLKPETPRKTVKLVPNTLIDGFESPLFWYTFNYSTHAALTGELHTQGERGLRFDFDGERYPWPTLYTVFSPGVDLRSVKSLSVDVHAPADLPDGFTMTMTVAGKEKGSESPKSPLKPGWNTFTAELTGEWLEDAPRSQAKALLWNIDCNRQNYAGSLVFDNLRPAPKDGAALDAGAGSLTESWETKLLWQAYNAAVTQEQFKDFHTQGGASMKLLFDLERCPSPRLYATLDPMLDMSDVKSISLDAMVPADVPNCTLRLVVVSGGQRYLAPPIAVKPGQQHLEYPLDPAWLPADAKSAVEQMEFVVTAPKSLGKSWIAVDNLRGNGK